nr:hypothetical protein [Tanacetum cinerariifolium]
MGSTNDKQKHFVLVHGLCHGAWCWFKVKPLLEAAGHHVSVFDLSASGSMDTKVIQNVTTFCDYTRPLLDFMATIPSSEKVVLVGHSLGGMKIALAMENFPEKVSLAIFLTAYMPDTFVERTPPEAWLDTQFMPYNDEINSEVLMLFGPKFLSLNMYQLCSDQDRELGKNLLRPGSIFVKDLSNTKQLTEEGYGSVSRVFVVTDEDKTITKDFQTWMIDNNPVIEVQELKGVDHMPMLCDPKQLTACLLDIAHRRA